jgi:GNAT superfamily N-acetyltransferase
LRHQFELQDAFYREHYLGAAFFVVEAEAEPIGRLYLHRQAAELRMMDIALLHAWRGAGRGTALILDVVEHADRKGLPLSLHVEAHNPVQSLYARLGFEFREDRGVYQFLVRPVRAGEAA